MTNHSTYTVTLTVDVPVDAPDAETAVQLAIATLTAAGVTDPGVRAWVNPTHAIGDDAEREFILTAGPSAEHGPTHGISHAQSKGRPHESHRHRRHT